MANLYKKPVLLKNPKTGEKVKTKSKKWWGQYKAVSYTHLTLPTKA